MMVNGPELGDSSGKERIPEASKIPKALGGLLGNVKASIEQARASFPQRTDMADPNATLPGTLRRLEVQNKIKTLVKNDTDPLLKTIETVADIRNLSIEQLIALEDAHEGILLYAFSDVATAGTQIDLEKFYWKPEAGISLRIDFRGNQAAEDLLGASDIFPPSVRRITVYENGNVNLARTSTHRIGLKGRNQEGTGFFDDQGYMPIYSGDTIVVGGASKESGGVDLDFDEKYRNPNGSLNLELYAKEQGEGEKKFMDTMRDRGVRMSKEYTPEDLALLQSQIEASGANKAVVDAAISMLADKTPGAHCWDWIDKVYKRAGATFKTVYKGHNYKHKLNKSDPGFDKNPQNPPALQSVAPGDWLFTYNRNGVDSKDAHSILVVRWIDKANLIAEAASCPSSGRPGRLHKVDFKKTPAVFIMKPILKRPL